MEASVKGCGMGSGGGAAGTHLYSLSRYLAGAQAGSEVSTLVYMCHIFFIHSSNDGHLG